MKRGEPQVVIKRMITNTNRNTSLFTLLTVLFIGLKLCGVIEWSWWWVLVPLWGPYALIFGIILVILAVCGMIIGISMLLDYTKNQSRTDLM